MDKPRLIEHAFPLKQASLDSVHEKNVRHGHISTLHIWPARRPLAACRAALIATLLPDPEDPRMRKEILEKLGGKVVEKIERKKMPSGKIVENIKEETVGGILHWKRETEDKETVDWFREEIRKAYGGRAPKVLDPFAGGGAIPLEAMRLGCEVTAIDINPVAWFILKCTLEYPQKLAGQRRPLPDFILKDRDFMQAFFKAQGLNGALLRTQLEKLGLGENSQPFLNNFQIEEPLLEADLAWHVRAWGKWVLNQARKDLAKCYPTYADFEPLKKSGREYQKREMKLVPLRDDGTPDLDALNAEFDKKYLEDSTNPRWVAKPTVAYLWARTVKCKNCRATVPLLKTRWLCKKANKRVLLTMEPTKDKRRVLFGVQNDVPIRGGNAAQRREHDKRIGIGTMSKSGVTCLCCSTIITMEDIRLEGKSGKIGAVITSVIVDGVKGNEYMPPKTPKAEFLEAQKAISPSLGVLDRLSIDSPMRPASTRSISCHLYGVKSFSDLFTPRQVGSLTQIGWKIHSAYLEMKNKGYPVDWLKALGSYLSLSFDRLLAFNCVNVRWKPDAEAVVDAFSRFSISLLWDFAESQPVGDRAGSWKLCYERIATALDNYSFLQQQVKEPKIIQTSAADLDLEKTYNLIITDPPYYQAISYADLSDFFYVWLRGVLPFTSNQFTSTLTPKASEIVQHIREDKDRAIEKEKYEEGMFEAFRRGCKSLKEDGRYVCVFAHKDPVAWETLVSAMIRAGLVVTASWPIQTEMHSRQRASSTASLASSVWLVCKKRPLTARPGWDNKVLEEMRENITTRLRDFWDAGIRGPDFVWAATGPALEAYSKHPVVKKANEPGKLMDVSEFLRQVRRMVVDFVVGRVLPHDGESEEVSGLDDVTTYYLLHRHDFGMNDAPAGPCILYAVSCGLTDGALVDQFDILAKTGGRSSPEIDEEESSDEEIGGGTGSTLRLKQWHQRRRQSMGYDPAVDSAKAQAKTAQMTFFPVTENEKSAQRREIPLIDQVHRLMHLWKAGDLIKVDDYLDSRALLRNNTFHQFLQAIVELAGAGSEERSILESISNHLKARGVSFEDRQEKFFK